MTYDDDHLPDDGGLNVKHWQNFAKQVRHKIGSFRFYHCGEYGGDTLRPHYHACMFGIDFSEDREICEMSGDYPLYKSKKLQECWPHGYIWIGAFTFDTAAYVARYVMEKLTGERAIEYGGAKPDYCTMSNRPGIGNRWYEEYGIHAHHMDSIWLDGKTLPMPKYYDRLLEAKQPEAIEKIKASREQEAEKWKDDQTEARLEVREICAKSNATYKTRHSSDIFIKQRKRKKTGIPGLSIDNSSNEKRI